MDAYWEIIDAHDAVLAKNCDCKVGQSVARVYPLPKGEPWEFKGTRKQAEAFIAEKMKD